MIRAYQDEQALEDLALIDTLRAAAPYQRLRAVERVKQLQVDTPLNVVGNLLHRNAYVKWTHKQSVMI